MMTFKACSVFWNNRPIFSAFCAGFCIGIFVPLIYLLMGGDIFIFVPLWAKIIFYPGLLTGNLVYPLIGFSGAIFSGITALALFYGLIGMGIRGLIMTGSKRNRIQTL